MYTSYDYRILMMKIFLLKVRISTDRKYVQWQSHRIHIKSILIKHLIMDYEKKLSATAVQTPSVVKRSIS
jgi:hypothetical protein